MSRRGGDVARAAWLYYLEEFTQGEVASEMGVSRSTVVRLLQRAKETGLVHITLDVPQEVFEMERELERLYGLNKVRLVPEAGDEVTLKHWLGHAAAEMVDTLVKPETIIAVSWGTTLQAMVGSLNGEHAMKGTKIVPLVGGLHWASSGTNAYWVAEQLARHLQTSSHALYAPVYVENRSAADALIQEPGIKEALALIRQASLAICSVGALDEGATLIQLGHLSPEERAFLQERGAVGDLACRWIDINGNPVELPSTINPIGASLEDLKEIPERMMVSGGEPKREALLGALRGGYITTLVTDEGTAVYLLESMAEPFSKNPDQARKGSIAGD